MNPLISVDHLKKTFRIYTKRPGLLGSVQFLFSRESESIDAVDEVTFDIEAGESVGYIGKNGAGKSTTIKLMTGILVPTSGSVHVDGIEPHKNRKTNAMRIGVVFGQKSHLRWDIPVGDSFRLLREVYEIPGARYRENVARFTEWLGLGEFLARPVRKLSLGQRMRCDLAAAFLHDPKVVYLDEPTIGLDVLVKDTVRRFIREINEQDGTTVILTTHDLRDVEQLCKRAILIDQGKVVYDGDLLTIKKRYGATKTIEFDVVNRLPENSHIDLPLPGGAEVIEAKEHTIRIRFDTNLTSSSAVARPILDSFNVSDFSIEETSVEDVVKRLYRGDA